MESKRKMFTKKDPITTLETRPLEGEVKCFKCGQVHSYEGLLDGGKCTNCQQELIGELF